MALTIAAASLLRSPLRRVMQQEYAGALTPAADRAETVIEGTR
jgi:hypothetical protein